ncbi:MAG: tyrosine-type recombinase/integrase [Nitriliruptorales bacterium]
MTKKAAPVTFPNGVKMYDETPTRGSWRVVWTDPATGRRRSARRVDKEEAQAAAYGVAAQLGKRGNGRDGNPAPRSSLPVSELVAYYLDEGNHERPWSESYAVKQESVCRVHIAPHIGGKACDWTVEDSKQILARVRGRHLSPETVRGVGVTMRGMVTAAHVGGFLPQDYDPMAGVRYSRRSSVAGQSALYVPPERIPDLGAVERLADAMDRLFDTSYGLRVRLSAFSGLRQGEMFGLTPNDIDVDGCVIQVRRQVTSVAGRKLEKLPKSEKTRITVFPTWLATDVTRRMETVGDPGGLMFPAEQGGHENASNWMGKRFRPACEEAGWPKDSCRHHGRHAFDWCWNWHSLRHVFCTWALATQPEGLGLEVADVSLFAGHYSPAFTYAAYVSPRANAAERARRASERSERPEL